MNINNILMCVIMCNINEINDIINIMCNNVMIILILMKMCESNIVI